MEKEQEGIVLEVIGDMAKVKASRHNDCDNCGACPGNTAIVVEMRNPVGARKGQFVAFEIKQVGMLQAAFVVYVLPLVAVVAGVIAGWYAAGKYGGDVLWYQVGGGFWAFLLSIVYIRFFDRNARASEKMQPVITRIISN
ncbi:MAG TPA: SoxR reducing system RseC family protein [Patescibacteria group bacterium]|nr:SoxR reducing system RseC family protein [Patescibacteria group bacterium]